MRKNSLILACAGIGFIGLAGAGCRNDGGATGGAKDMTITGGNPDLTQTVSGDMAGVVDNPDMTKFGNCTGFIPSTIAALRDPNAMNMHCYQLDNVVVVGLTPSAKSPRIFVQDAAGGDYSALMGRCSSTSTSHPCPVFAAVAGVPVGNSITLTGEFIKSKATHLEDFYIATITENNGPAGSVPAAKVLQPADIQKSALKPEHWNQRVSVDVSADPLAMYDWSPSELVFSGASACPYQLGFAMIATSAAAAAAPACMNSKTQPATQSMPAMAETLIGTDFYNDFKVTSDCRCGFMFKNQVPSATSTLGGTIPSVSGFLRCRSTARSATRCSRRCRTPMCRSLGTRRWCRCNQRAAGARAGSSGESGRGAKSVRKVVGAAARQLVEATKSSWSKRWRGQVRAHRHVVNVVGQVRPRSRPSRRRSRSRRASAWRNSPSTFSLLEDVHAGHHFAVPEHRQLRPQHLACARFTDGRACPDCTSSDLARPIARFLDHDLRAVVRPQRRRTALTSGWFSAVTIICTTTVRWLGICRFSSKKRARS